VLKKLHIKMLGYFVIKPNRCTNFTNLFCHETLHVSDSSSVHLQEFIHSTLSNGICRTGLQTAFEQDQDGTQLHLVGFITKKFVMMHGHMYVKNAGIHLFQKADQCWAIINSAVIFSVACEIIRL
jgi:hypothetical protein